jgi:hypothetical protein
MSNKSYYILKNDINDFTLYHISFSAIHNSEKSLTFKCEAPTMREALGMGSASLPSLRAALGCLEVHYEYGLQDLHRAITLKKRNLRYFENAEYSFYYINK